MYTASQPTSGPAGAVSVSVGVSLYNTSASTTETVLLTLTGTGGTGTARTVARVVLAPNEAALIAGLVMADSDILKGSATDATTVDYVVSIESAERARSVVVLDSKGQAKTLQTATSTDNLTVGASTAAAGTTTANAGALPAGTAGVYPTTAADDTKGVVISASDQVTGRKLFIGNGVSNKILKVYPPSGGTVNGAAADAAYSSASGKGVSIVCLNGAGNTWLATG